MSDDNNNRWWHGREGALMAIGILIVLGEFINAEILGRTFHYEFLILAAGLFGVGLAQLGDRR